MYVRPSPLLAASGFPAGFGLVTPWLALLVALSGFAGCSSGGGGAAVSPATPGCAGTNTLVMCLTSCNLGCNSNGCLRTDIAQNEIILLQFSSQIDPISVSPSSIRFRTASGEQPVGEFFVNGNTVEWVPTLSISGGQTFFGFAAGETYTMTIPGGSGPSLLRSTSGQPLDKTLTCTLQSNRGIVDLNGVAPLATMIVPSAQQLGGAPLDTNVVLEFNELIDATPFISGTASPVSVVVRRTLIGASGARECDPASPPQVVSGTQNLTFDAASGRSVLTFHPAQPFPGNVCVEANVTNGVVDLSGRPAQPRTYPFLTMEVPLVERTITEEFDDPTFLDVNASASQWQGGMATFASIGGDARHGTFDVNLGEYLGNLNGKRTYRFNTDNTIIPATNTTTGSALAVTNGQYFFDQMVVPADVRLVFVGSFPPIITVSGRLDLQGEIDVAGQSVSAVGSVIPAMGQAGGAGGIFGGAGGQGGDKCNGLTLAVPGNSGRDGGTVHVLAGHGYFTSAAATAGRGSSVYPSNGLTSSIYYGPVTPPNLAYSPMAAAGGGGGGLRDAGMVGRVVANNHPNPTGGAQLMGPQAPGGSAMTLFPFPPPTGATRSSTHFLVGGSGGGGAGSQACMSLNLVASSAWASGGGGGGGGGAIALRAGDSLRIGPTGRVLANGGSGANSSGTSGGGQPGPGGGGSGGSVVLQTGRVGEMVGVLDVRGGLGGQFTRTAGSGPPGGASVQIAGGDGSPGFVRFEVPTAPPLTALAGMLPAPIADNVGELTERDDLVSFRSLYYSTGLLFGPEYVRYEIHAVVDGVPMVFSDDPAVSNLPAQTGNVLRALFQSARLDLTTLEPLEVGPWHASVRSTSSQTGIASEGFNGFRYQILFDRMLAQTVTIDRVVIAYRN